MRINLVTLLGHPDFECGNSDRCTGCATCAPQGVMNMSYRISPMDREEPFGLGQSAWQRACLPQRLGSCFTDSLSFDDGLAVAYSSFDPQQDLVEAGSFEGERALTVAIALSGRSSSTGMDGQRHDFVCGHSTVATYGSLQGERCYPAKQAIRQLRLTAKAPLLQRYGLEYLLDGEAKGLSAKRLFCAKHSVVIQRLADSLVHLHDTCGGLLDIHTAALGLLAEQIRPLVPSPAPLQSTLSAKDKDVVLAARDILLSQFDRKLTIGYLCAALGTNEFKLKQGFREVFGTSPYRLLTDIRMAKAREWLEAGLPVSSVAYKVGFEHLSSFSAAFEKYYGCTPKSLRQGRAQALSALRRGAADEAGQ
ncbi:helix-turn-helix transcriptional regulator [Pantoea sp. Ap-967]|nr:helix-turn-helix transcriptional regulator [Pantoea sp. Ap-967]